MATKKTEHTLQDLIADEQLRPIMEKLQNSIIELATVITQKIVYNVFQNINVSTPVKPNSATVKKITQTQKTTRRKRTSDWSQKTNSAIYSALNHRRKKQQDIEPELLAEIQKRFPTYNPETKTIVRRSTKLTNWPNMTKRQLRTARSSRMKAGQPLEPGLVAELQKHFPNYDSATNKFIHKKINWAEKSKKSLQNAINYRKSHGQKIPSEITNALAEKSQKKTTIRTDWSDVPRQNLRAAYHYRKKHNMPIEPKLNAALSTAFPSYDATAQKFTGKRTRPSRTVVAQKAITKPADPVIATGVTKTKIQNPSEIPVYIEYVKSDLHGAYNNVYVNGTRVLTNHYNTDIKLLFDGTLLAIHGIITDNHDFPKRPIWQVYDTELKSKISLQKQKFSGYNIHATNISERDDALYLNLSNRCTAIIKRDRIIKEAGPKRFIITRQKTK